MKNHVRHDKQDAKLNPRLKEERKGKKWRKLVEKSVPSWGKNGTNVLKSKGFFLFSQDIGTTRPLQYLVCILSIIIYAQKTPGFPSPPIRVPQGVTDLPQGRSDSAYHSGDRHYPYPDPLYSEYCPG